MEREELVNLAIAADRLILTSRFRDLSIAAQSDRSDRVGAIAGVLSKLPPGGYLIGCGPYTCGVFPLTVDEIVLGRPPSPLESLPDSVADFTLNDAVWMLPREASRVHAKITRRHVDGAVEYSVSDEGSRLGTYINNRTLGVDDHCGTEDESIKLCNGDVICLGPSGVNRYVFVLL